MKYKVLILTNPLNHEGGVVNYYNLFFKHFKSDAVALKHASIGSRAYLFYYPTIKRFLYPFYFVFDLFIYALRLFFDRKIKIVQVSPSLIPVPLIRDGVLVIIAKILGKKVIVFYRGWKLPVYEKIKSKVCLKKVFNYVFQNNTNQIVLASAFKEDLIKLNPKKSKDVFVTTTAIDKSLIKTPEDRGDSEIIRVMFLGRVEDLKGIEELIDAVILLNKAEELKHFTFSIVGHEARQGYIDELKKKLTAYDISESQLKFLGRVDGEDKYKLYIKHDVYVLPSYTEGCPNSVLEALASGLFSITTPVGALNDIITEHNGILIPLKDSDSIKNALIRVKNDRALLERGKDICKVALDQFDIVRICQNFENIYTALLTKK